MTDQQNQVGNKKRLVWIDWLLLLFLTAAILLGARFWMRRRDAAEPTTQILYTVCLYTCDAALSETGDWSSLIPYGTTVTNAMGTAELGSVSGVTVRNSRTVAVKKGEVVTVEIPERVDLLITVRASATQKTGDGLRVNDIRIAAGGKGDFRIGELYADGASIISVEKREDR